MLTKQYKNGNCDRVKALKNRTVVICAVIDKITHRGIDETVLYVVTQSDFLSCVLQNLIYFMSLMKITTSFAKVNYEE